MLVCDAPSCVNGRLARCRDAGLRGFFVATVLCLMAGCHAGRPQVAEGWSRRSAPTLADDVTRDKRARLQIIVCYGRRTSNHAAVRLATGDGTVLFWDPGGGYHVQDPAAVGRRADLVSEHPPTLGQWWRYRGSFIREPFNEVFEWDLDGSDGRDLAVILQQGAVYDEAGKRFQTAAAGGACGLAVSEFLHRYGRPYVTIRRRYFWPHDLGRVLWQQNPDRVVVLHFDADIDVWTRDAPD